MFTVRLYNALSSSFIRIYLQEIRFYIAITTIFCLVSVPLEFKLLLNTLMYHNRFKDVFTKVCSLNIFSFARERIVSDRLQFPHGK